MKIKKQLIEQKLHESEEDVVSTDISAAEIKQAVKADGQNVSDAEAKEMAEVTQEVGDAIDTDEVILDTGLGVENKITKVLDRSLRLSKRAKDMGKKPSQSNVNVLICGLPGSGKTATVSDWCKSRGVEMVYVDCKNKDLQAWLNGYTSKKSDGSGVTQLYSDNLGKLDSNDPKYKNNCILFLDELNRQVNKGIRGSVLTLVQDHAISGKSADGSQATMHELPNLLFTVACINPQVEGEGGVSDLDNAELSRFHFTMSDLDSDPETTRAYFEKYYPAMLAKQAKKKDKGDAWKEETESIFRAWDLGDFIVNDPRFKYDGRDALTELRVAGDKGIAYTLFCQRSFCDAIEASEGDPDLFMEDAQETSNWLPSNIEMLDQIISDYVKPANWEIIAKERGYDPATAKPETKAEEPAATEPEVEIEDDAALFAQAEQEASDHGIDTNAKVGTRAHIDAALNDIFA